jgi:Ca2+-binding EF-hand superfamily protein
MINKANPSVDGNTVLYEEDFIAMMAEAEYSAFFRDAFSLLDKKGFGWVEAGKVAEILNELKIDSGMMDAAMAQFGVDSDGHILYETFVDLLMSTSHAATEDQAGASG